MEGAILLRQAVERGMDTCQRASPRRAPGANGIRCCAELQFGDAVDTAGIGEHQTQVGFARHQLGRFIKR